MIIFDDTHQKSDAQFEKIFEAISNEDADALKGMFSERALSEANDFDENTQLLLDYVQGDLASWKRASGGGDGEEREDGNRKKIVQSEYILTTSEQEYHIGMYEWTIDTADPDNVGVYAIYIVSTEDNPNPKFVFWKGCKAGIHVGL